MIEILVILLILFPMGAAALCCLVRTNAFRTRLVAATGAMLAGASLVMLRFSPGPLQTIAFSISVTDALLLGADLLLIAVFLWIGLRHRHGPVIGLVLIQALLLLLHAVSAPADSSRLSIRCDGLSLLMLTVISMVGAVIAVQAIPYMADHEIHLKLNRSRQPRFFAVMLLFLGAMNGVVLADSLTHFFLFFEVTTLCSYLLIAHDRTEVAVRNALTALWINSLGGAALMAAILWLHHSAGISSFSGCDAATAPSALILPPMALICLAGFTKAAQFPFQSWLLGAMVAPTPVSALLHSATMVKAGVYLVLRMAPCIQGTFLGTCVTLFGAFSFLSAAALAVGQRNGKRVLAYSTISNLGLMFGCAGMGTPAAWSAAVFLLLFHAVTKAQLFLCVGAIEQRIESRDIEDMRGLYSRMPATALITVLGVITMIMPPFGLMLGKWMALEAAARHLPALLMLALGSALTVMYWARWVGTLMSDPLAEMRAIEQQPVLTWFALGALSAGAVLLSAAAPWLYAALIRHALTGAETAFAIRLIAISSAAGTFAVFPLCLLAGGAFVVSLYAVRRALSGRVVPPYLCGSQAREPGSFTGPANQVMKAEAGNYYFTWLFGEARMTAWVNLGAVMLLILMLGGAVS